MHGRVDGYSEIDKMGVYQIQWNLQRPQVFQVQKIN